MDQIDEGLLLSNVDLSQFSPGEWQGARKTTERELAASIDLTAPPLIRAALVEYGPEYPQELLLAIHHWAYDPVALGILIEDLRTAYRQLKEGETISLPKKTTSFKAWSETLIEYGKSDAAKSQVSYWKDQLGGDGMDLPIEPPVKVGSWDDAQPIIETLTREETYDLLHETVPGFKAHMDEVLLAAIADSLSNSMSVRDFRVGLVSHGRSHTFDGIDVSRTVGWFSTEYPLHLKTTPNENLAETMEEIKRLARTVPDQGIGYGVLRYMNHEDELIGLREPSIRLNNQGNFTAGEAPRFFRVVREANLIEFRNGFRDRLLNIGVSFIDGCLSMEWMFDRRAYDEAEVRALASQVVASLRSIITTPVA
jgi:non-ribosomal peptide synthase protein (TIGR01720 family)